MATRASGAALETLAHVASNRHVVEQCFEETKDDPGLDQYEVRTWPSWHRLVTLTMMAFAWLSSVRAKLAEPSSSLSRAVVLEEARGGAREKTA